MKISIVIPVFNEEKTLTEIIRRVESAPYDKEIILIDDCSSDSSRKILEEYQDRNGFKLLYHDQNLGKGAALRTGFKQVSGEVVIIQDADLEYNPNDYDRLLEPIQDNRADVVFGSRFLGGPHRVMFFWHYVGNKNKLNVLPILNQIMPENLLIIGSYIKLTLSLLFQSLVVTELITIK